MSTIMLVTVPGQPVPQGRPRFSRFSRGRTLAHPVAFDPPRAREWKRGAVVILRSTARGAEWKRREGPMRVRVLAVHQRPKALKGDLRAWHAARGDADNYAKAALDAITAAGCIWSDDGQVAQLEVVKVYGRQDETPRVEILIEALA